MTTEEEVRRFLAGLPDPQPSPQSPDLPAEGDVRAFLDRLPEPEPSFLDRVKGGVSDFLEAAGRAGTPGSRPPPEPEEVEYMATAAEEVPRQLARGVGEAGLATATGLSEIAGAAERAVRSIPGKLGELSDAARRITQPGMAGMRGAPTPPPEPPPTAGESAAGKLRGVRDDLREWAGEPETGYGTAAGIAGRVAGEAAQFIGPSALVRLARGARAITTEQGLRQAISALGSREGRRAAGERVAPKTLPGRVAEDIAIGAPVDIAISAAGPEESAVGGIGELLGDRPAGETLREIAEHPVARAAADVALGAIPGVAADIALGRGARAVDPIAPREPSPPTIQLPEPVREVAPAPPRLEPEIAPEARGGVGAAPEPKGPEVTQPAPTQPAAEGVRPEAEKTGQPGFARVGDVKGFFRRHFTSAGDLPEPVFKRKVERDGWINSQMRQVRYTQRDFDRATKQAFGDRPTSEQLEQIDDALKGEIPAERAAAEAEFKRLEQAKAGGDETQIAVAREALRTGRGDRARRAIESLPEPLRPVVQRMRAQVDALSRRGIEEGLFEGPLAARVGDNLGVYATRSYRAFDDPDWAEKVPQDVRNRAKGLLRSEFPDAPEEEIDGLIDELLYRKEDGPIAFLASGKLGSKPRSLFMGRQDIHPAIRELLGEYRDPHVNYARSVQKMATGVANHRFLNQVKAEGLGKFLFEKPIVREGQSYRKQIAAKGSKVMEPLNGLYTTPEIEAAFRESLDPAQPVGWLRLYMKANTAAKYSKTILSPMTHVRNTVGNAGFAVAQGHWRAANMGKAWRTVLNDVGVMREQGFRDYFRELQELGVVHEGVRAGELHDAVRDASKMDVGVYSEHAAERGLRKALRGAEELYQAEDNVWKIYAYENELARYRKALPDMPEPELKQLAAGIVRDTYPTYSLIPGAIRAIRRFPLVGTFVSFPAEVARTGYNTLRLIQRELANPKLREIGVQRLAGTLAAITGVSAAAAASRHLVGVTLEEDRDVRRFLPYWSKNSNLFYLGKKDGKLQFTDLSYTDPYSYLRKPLVAMLNGEDWEGAMLEAAVEAARPFLDEDMVTEKLLDVARNRERDGGEVYNPQAPFHDRLKAVISHVWEGFEPGVVSQGQRIGMGLTGKQTIHGRSYDPALEAAAVFTGLRLTELDVPQSLSFRARDFNREIADANRQLSAIASRRGSVSDDELRAAYVSAEQSRQRLYERMHRDALAALRLGMREDQVAGVLGSAGLTGQEVDDVLDGYYAPREVSDRFLQGVAQSAEALADDPDEAYEEFERRRELIQGLGAEREDAELSDAPPTALQRLPAPARRVLEPGMPTETDVRAFLERVPNR